MDFFLFIIAQQERSTVTKQNEPSKCWFSEWMTSADSPTVATGLAASIMEVWSDLETIKDPSKPQV